MTIWQKKLRRFTLIEFPEAPNGRNCVVRYQHELDDFTFTFGSWGMDREGITVEDCAMSSQHLLLEKSNGSISSFAEILECAQNEYDEMYGDDEDE